MKKLFPSLMVLLMILVSACNEEVKPLEFPTSTVTPAARISAAVSQDAYENTRLTVQTESLTQPERLTPSQRIYIVWVETKKMGNINVGKLYPKAEEVSSLQTLTPFTPVSVFITAEKTAYVKEPEGIEIARLKL